MIKNYKYLNNYSDILSYSNDLEFKNIVDNLNEKDIIINTHLIHKKNKITIKEQFIFNLDNYISYIKSLVHINPLLLKYIINNTLYNKYNKILFSEKYYYSNTQLYIREFQKMFMYKYKKNYLLLKKYADINRYSFTDLIEVLNNNKRAYIYFENITKQNILYYLNIIKYIN